MAIVLNIVLIAMIICLLIPIYAAWNDEDIWQNMLALASASTKASLMVLLISVLRDDWMIGVSGVIMLSVGNAGFMLLAHILKRVEES
jgi:multicomponent Na+:H+ antiporter subunit F